jgi:ribosome-associated translation inhibitor RaiA
MSRKELEMRSFKYRKIIADLNKNEDRDDLYNAVDSVVYDLCEQVDYLEDELKDKQEIIEQLEDDIRDLQR